MKTVHSLSIKGDACCNAIMLYELKSCIENFVNSFTAIPFHILVKESCNAYLLSPPEDDAYVKLPLLWPVAIVCLK